MNATGTGIVVSLHARKCQVVSDCDGTKVECLLRGKLFEKLKGDTKPIAVGDRVRYGNAPTGATVEEIFPRRNALTRPAIGKRGTVQTIAANIDRMIIVASVKNPPFRSGLIDRFLVSAGREGYESVICINKIDLLPTTATSPCPVHKAADIYAQMGYTVLFTSALSGEGIAALTEALKEGISLIVGHSGVGKSTLINRIDPRLNLKTGAVSSKEKKGQHTTTRVSLLKIAEGGFVVDTPGIREFGIHEMRPADLGHYFPEIARLLPDCQYADCTHLHEPNCAILAALETGGVTKERYRSYLKILEEISK